MKLIKIENKNNISDNSISKLGILDQFPELKIYNINNIKKQRLYQFSLKICDIFKLGIYNITKKGKILQKEYNIIKNEIINYADFINIGKNIIEVEKIKKILDGQFDKNVLFTQNKKCIILNEKHLNSNYYKISKFLNKKQTEI